MAYFSSATGVASMNHGRSQLDKGRDKSPARVLILHDYAGSRGGAELLSLDLRRGLRARGIDARLMTTTADAHDMDPEAAPDYTCFGTSGRLRAFPETYNPSARRELQRVLETFKPDVVSVLMFMTALSPAILSALRDVPTVILHMTYREICPTGLRWRPNDGLCDAKAGWACQANGCFGKVGILPRIAQMKLLDRYAGIFDRRVAPSHAMANILDEQGWNVTDVLPFGIPPHEGGGTQSQTPLIAYAGRLTEEKGVGWLLDAVAHAGARLGDTRVEILGDGPAREGLEAQAHGLGIADRVMFRGKVKRTESQNVLGRAWLQVIPSLWPEPFGLVAAEALARGTPALVTDQGAPPEIVEHGKTGWVVPVGNVSAMAERLIEAVEDPARLAEMGQAGIAAAKARYSVERWVDGCVDIFRQISTPAEPRTADHSTTEVREATSRDPLQHPVPGLAHGSTGANLPLKS